MKDYIRKYQSGDSLSTSNTEVSDYMINNSLGHVDQKVTSILSGLSRQVYDDEDSSNLHSLNSNVSSLKNELMARKKNAKGNDKYKDLSYEQIGERYTKLKNYQDSQIKRVVDGTLGNVLDYLDTEFQKVQNDPLYTAEDRLKIEGYFAKKKREWTDWGNKAWKDGTFENLQKQIKDKEIGYTKKSVTVPIQEYKNGGKLIPRYQSGNSLLANDPDLLSIIRGESYINQPQSGYGVYRNNPSYNEEGYGVYQNAPVGNNTYANQPQNNGAGYINKPGVGEDYINNPDIDTSGYKQHPVSNFGGNYISSPMTSNPGDGPIGPLSTYSDYKAIAPFKSIPNFTLSGTKGSFGNQVDRSFGQNSGTAANMLKTEPEVNTSITTSEQGKKANAELKGVGSNLISRSGLFGGAVQWSDVLQYALARKAYKRPVAIVPVYQESFQGQGSRNVRSISGIDSSIRNKVSSDIASIGGSGYQGSDPILNMITNMRISDAKKKAKMEWAGTEAEHIRNEEARYAQESEQKRAQVAADLVEANRVSNANRLNVVKGAHDAALAEQQRESDYSKNIATISSTMQGRLNKNVAQRNDARALLWKEARDRDYNTLISNLDSKKKELAERNYYQRDKRNAYIKSLGANATEAAIKKYDNAYIESNKDLYKDIEDYSKKLSKYSGDQTEDYLEAHTKVSTVEPLFKSKKKKKKTT